MAYKYTKEEDGTTAIVISGFEQGIAASPHQGIANMQGVNISTETGEAMCNFNRFEQFQTGTTGSLTQVNTNTVSISGVTLLAGQVITIVTAGTTGLSGDYYYLSTGKLYAGDLPPNTPDSATAVTGITSGTATFSIKYALGKPIMKATEIYHRDNTNTLYYRYYFLDSLGTIWCHDSYTLVNWNTPVWFVVGNTGIGTSGLAVLNGWLTVTNGTSTYWKLTSLLGSAFVDSSLSPYTFSVPINFSSNSFHNMLYGQQGKLYGTDGTFVTSLFPTTSILTGGANIQSYAEYSGLNAGGAQIVINGTFTGSATGWAVGTGWAYGTNNVVKGTDGTGILSQTTTLTITTGQWYSFSYTISGWTVGTIIPNVANQFITTQNNNGTYVFTFQAVYTGNVTIYFNASNTSRFTIDNISLTEVGESKIDALISGSAPTTGTLRIPAVFYTDGTLPTGINANTIYWIQYVSLSKFYIFEQQYGGAGDIPIDPYTGAVGNQYFDTFVPVGVTLPNAGALNSIQNLFTWSPQRLNLPFYETATVMAEIGNTVLIGGVRNIIYPWNQVSPLPQDIIFLPEDNTVNIISVNNTGYIFCGTKGNIYATNGSSVSKSMTVPDYTAGVAGIPNSYIEPYFSWGDAMYCRGRVYFGVQDQTATKQGNCGGVWSFTPVQNFFSAENGLALRLDNQNSYGTYNGLATLLISNFNQIGLGAQYWSGWESDITAPTYGMDYTDVIPEETTIIESDLMPIGTALDQKTFNQIEYKLATPLASGETVVINYRQNGTDAWTSLADVEVESPTDLSGIYPVNFQKGQWLQLQAILNPLNNTSSSFMRLTELRIR